MIAIGITATPVFVRLTRGQVLTITVEDYVEAARARRQHEDAHRLEAHPAQHHAAASGAGRR
jgi:ABC-type dipeptide/oligopeptide/nickel transport system permease component